MARTIADRTWRESAPEAIEADLAALWREVAGADARIARAVMSNLIVFRDRVAPADAAPAAIVAGLPLDEVASRHPSRVIILEHCRGERPDAPFAAGVGIVTFGPPNARYGVEEIVMRSACPDASLLSILRRFVRGDLPTTVWWTEDLSDAPPMEPFLQVGRQLLYDSRRWRDVGRGVAALAPVVDNPRIDLADLNWRRLTALRQGLVSARGPLSSAAWRRVAVRIVCAPGEDALAWLCAGWLRSVQRDPSAPAPTVEARSLSGALLIVSVDNVTATVTSRTVTIAGASAHPMVVTVAIESEVDAIADELRTLSRDDALIAAVEVLLRVFGAR
jgi:glucose-6-phosphate dehydrogenase assembly protein OpcA